jgi:hypothetical protein
MQVGEAKLIKVHTEKTEEDKECAICKDNSKTHAFSCGHVCACEECASDLTRCPSVAKKGKHSEFSFRANNLFIFFIQLLVHSNQRKVVEPQVEILFRATYSFFIF